MSALAAVAAVDEPGTEMVLDPEGSLKLTGTVTSQNPGATLAVYFRNVHEAALKDRVPKFEVDVTDLTFVNSSAIRTFIDWATWLKEAEPDKRYALTFTTNYGITWQKTTFTALKTLVGDVIEVR